MSIDTVTMDNFFHYAGEQGFGDIHFKIDPQTGLQAIIAIHSTKFGPALGGCRFLEYPDTGAAVYDAMRLARGMSYKAACADLPLGGGKSVVIRPSKPFNKQPYFKRFAEFVNELNGRYVTAEDSGTTLEEMQIIAQYTPYVSAAQDPSPFTAEGVKQGIEAAVLFRLDKSSLQGIHVAVQGIGKVGYVLTQLLTEAGAHVTVADINPEICEKAKQAFKADIAPIEKIHQVPCDVFAPCALGGNLNDKTIPEIQASIVAGSANNQLAHTYHGQQLFNRNILYAPDYVINAGGLIYCAHDYDPENTPDPQEKISNIYSILLAIFERSAQEKSPTAQIADTIAEEKLSS